MPESFDPVPRVPPTLAPNITRGPETVNALRVVADVRDEFYWYMPSASPLVTLTNRLKRTRTATQRLYHWMTQDEYPRFLDIAVASNAADTTLDVVAGQGARVGARYLYQVLRTGEVVLATAAPAADTVTVIRGIGSAAQDLLVGDRLHFIGTAFESGTGKGTFKSTIEQFEFNYTQISKRSYGFDGRNMATKMYGGKDPMSERKKQSTEHAKDLEKILWWGRRHIIAGTATAHETTFAGGVDQFVTQTWNLGNTNPNERSFTEFLEFAMKWGDGGNLNGPGRKFLFAASRWVTEIEMFGKNILREVPGSEKTLGMSIKAYRSTHGDVFVVPTHILDESHPDTAFLLDLNHIAYVTHAERPTRLYKNIEDNDLDGEEEQYMSDVGLEVSLPDAHVKLVGIPV